MEVIEHGKFYFKHKCEGCGCVYGVSRADVICEEHTKRRNYTEKERDEGEWIDIRNYAKVYCPECGKMYMIASFDLKENKDGKSKMCDELERLDDKERFEWSF